MNVSAFLVGEFPNVYRVIIRSGEGDVRTVNLTLSEPMILALRAALDAPLTPKEIAKEEARADQKAGDLTEEVSR